MRIRDATPDDARALAEVRVDSWRSAYKGILPDDVLNDLDVTKSESRWLESLSQAPPGRIIVCEVEDVVVGFASYGPCRDGDTDPAVIAELYALYLIEQHWSRGLGYALWREVDARVRAMESRNIKVWMLQANQRARRFYERIGFRLEPDQIKDITLYGVTLPEVRYHHDLPREI